MSNFPMTPISNDNVAKTRPHYHYGRKSERPVNPNQCSAEVKGRPRAHNPRYAGTIWAAAGHYRKPCSKRPTHVDSAGFPLCSIHAKKAAEGRYLDGYGWCPERNAQENERLRSPAARFAAMKEN